MQEGVDIRRPPFNGPANHVREVVEALARRGHEVRTLVRVDGRIWKSDNLADFDQVTVRRLDRGPRRLVERGARRIQSELRLPYAAMFESRRFGWIMAARFSKGTSEAAKQEQALQAGASRAPFPTPPVNDEIRVYPIGFTVVLETREVR